MREQFYMQTYNVFNEILFRWSDKEYDPVAIFISGPAVEHAVNNFLNTAWKKSASLPASRCISRLTIFIMASIYSNQVDWQLSVEIYA